MDVHDKWGEEMKTLLICIFVIGVSVFLIGAGIGIAWMVIQDTALGRAIDEIMAERIERWKERASDDEPSRRITKNV